PLPTCFTPRQHKKHVPATTSPHLHKRMHKHTFIFFSVKMIRLFFSQTDTRKRPFPVPPCRKQAAPHGRRTTNGFLPRKDLPETIFLPTFATAFALEGVSIKHSFI
ncbi:MAG TPA: hypothetical protein IAD30_08055, partial [Bacteroidetes bacterium]|nr:hypothetical protein [Bacteroidota bacterium]